MSKGLDALANVGELGDGTQDVVVTSVFALTNDPDLVTSESAGKALDVLGRGSSVELTPDSASKGISAVSNILSASTTHQKSSEQQGEMASKIMRVVSSLMDSVDVTKPDKYGEERVLSIDSTLIKAKKTKMPKRGEGDDKEMAIGVSKGGNTGLGIGDTGERSLPTNTSVSLAEYVINTYAHNQTVAKQASGGVISISFKTGRDEIKVSNADLRVSLKVKPNA